LAFVFCCIVLLCVFTFLVHCCAVSSDISINTLFGSSLPLVICKFVRGLMSYLRYLCLFAYHGVQHILCCAFDLCFFVLCTTCCQFLWIDHLRLALRFSLTFISCSQTSALREISSMNFMEFFFHIKTQTQEQSTET